MAEADTGGEAEELAPQGDQGVAARHDQGLAPGSVNTGSGGEVKREREGGGGAGEGGRGGEGGGGDGGAKKARA